LSVLLLVLGGVLMFFAPENNILYGAVIVALGIVLEIAGVIVGHGKES
jgi:hypothetical protein